MSTTELERAYFWEDMVYVYKVEYNVNDTQKKNHIQKNINSDDTMLNNIILMVHNVMKH